MDGFCHLILNTIFFFYPSNGDMSLYTYGKTSQEKPSIKIRKVMSAPKKIEYKLSPYKDKLFAYSKILLSQYNGKVKTIEYIMKRDIEERDAIHVKRVKDNYVTILPKESTNEKSFISSSKTFNSSRVLNYYEVKDTKILNNEINVLVIYLHGLGGSRHQGVDDYTFGGNFNRIKNLMYNNKGVYISTDFTDFTKKGSEDIFTLISNKEIEYPNSKIIISGASSGGEVLWKSLMYNETYKKIDGIILLGSIPFIHQQILNQRIPIYIAHGNKDSNINVRIIKGFFSKVLSYSKDYPIKVELFNNGGHGVPIRMSNWKESITWILNHN